MAAENLEYVEIGKKEAARLVEGGGRLKRATEGYYMAPALFIDSAPEMRINQDEIFGPVAAVIRVKDYEEALAMANAVRPVGGDRHDVAEVREPLRAQLRERPRDGESVTAGLDYHVPFGGRKKSSYGPREQGTYTKDFYTVVKTAYVAP